MRVKTLDRMKLLERLERIRHSKEADRDQDPLRQMSLAGVLLELAGINHEDEYKMCRAVAEHRLGTVPEPDEIDAEER